jgi:hypothetical protein
MSDLTWTTEFMATAILEDYICANAYTMTISFDSLTDDAAEQSVALRRLRSFVDTVLEGSVLIWMEDTRLDQFREWTTQASQALITLPSEPSDMAMVAVLWHKLNSIAEGKLNVETLSLSSRAGDDITIHFNSEFADDSNLASAEKFEPLGTLPWWFRTDASTFDQIVIGEGDVKLNIDSREWGEGLIFVDPAERKNRAKLKKVVDNDATDLQTKGKFKPEIIDGGKTKH